MGRGADEDRRAVAGDGVSKPAGLARIRKIGKEFDAEALVMTLQKWGASASACLLPDDERDKRWKSADRITIPIEVADKIAAVLLSAPRKQKIGRRSDWPSQIWLHVVIALSAGQGVRELAREISEKTGQPFGSVRRRIQEAKAGELVKGLTAYLEEAREEARQLGSEVNLLEECRAFFSRDEVKEYLASYNRGAK
jgi:hypothetical protein